MEPDSRMTTQMPVKLEAVLARLCRRIPHALNTTQAVKLPYLVDVLANHVLGHPITGGHHQAWKHGVVTEEAWQHLAHGPSAVFRVTPVRFSEETRVEVLDDSSAEALSEDERRIVDFVAEEYAYVSATELGLLTKRMNPAISSWGGNRAADLGEDAYERMSPVYLEMAESVAEISLDRLRRESRPISSPEDVVA